MAVTGSITITQKSQDIVNNTSTIEVVGKATMTGASYDGYTRTGTVTIDGIDYSFSSTFPKGSTKQLFSKTVTVNHNSEGNKTVSASFRVTTGMTGTLSRRRFNSKHKQDIEYNSASIECNLCRWKHRKLYNNQY